MCHTKCVSLIGFLMDDELCVTVVSKYKKLLHFDVLKLGQILCVDKTGFLRSGHIYIKQCNA